MKKIIEQHKILFTLLLFLFVSIIAVYLTSLDGHIWSFLERTNDGRFHVMRMEGLYESIKQGNFFPVINMSSLGGFGYISNVFYSNLWLYPVAFLRLAGMTTVQAFIAFYIMVNFATFVTSFWSYYQASRRYDKSLLFSFVYTLSTYRIFDMIRRFDIGETLTLVFLPLVVLGVYEIFYGNYHKWIYLTMGMVMVIYSHALSPVLIAIFIFLVIIFRLRVLIKEPQRIVSLVYAGLVSLALSLAYFLPMFEQMKHTQFKLTNAPLIYVSQTGMSWKNFFNFSVTNDLYNQNIGILLLIVIIVIPFTLWKINNAAIRDFAIIGEILLFMSSDLFPWKYLDHTFLNMIQFPWRFYMIITILMAIYLTYDGLNLFNRNWKVIVMMVVTLGLTVGSEQILVKQHPQEVDTYAQFNHLNVYSIGGGQEYLPKNASLNALMKAPHTPQIQSGTAQISDFRQRGSQVSFVFQNAKQAKVDLPIIAYYGYSSKSSIGQVSKLKMDHHNNGLGQVTINGDGKVLVNYYPTTIQKISKIFSIFSFLILIIFFGFKKLTK